MSKSIDIIERHKCTGCQACRQICPKNAIDMKEDKEGFLYPVKNSNCIECGLCTKICPIINKVKNDNLIEQQVFAARHKSEDVVLKSSSGGAFTSIVQAFCDENYVVFGAKYDSKLNVVHDYITDVKDIEKFRKSKYVQSDVGNSYIQVKEFLKQGKKVLFSGTPCQIAGLKNYLDKDYENLLCVDLICHGVPSLKVFNKYKDFVEEKYNNKVKAILFREKLNKKKVWNSRNLLIELENGYKIIENSDKNFYLRGFHQHLFYRPSCKTCKFAKPHRYSDITIADCWQIEKIYPDMDVHKGQSLMIINSSKGQELLNQINKYQETKNLTLEFAIKSNAQFRQPTKFNKNREKFFEGLEKR